jgi:hypothetical protein
MPVTSDRAGLSVELNHQPPTEFATVGGDYYGRLLGVPTVLFPLKRQYGPGLACRNVLDDVQTAIDKYCQWSGSAKVVTSAGARMQSETVLRKESSRSERASLASSVGIRIRTYWSSIKYYMKT